MAAIIPKIPEKVPAKKEFKVFLFISQPKKELGRHSEDGEILKLIEEDLG